MSPSSRHLIIISQIRDIQSYLGDIAGLVPDHRNKANIVIKRVTRIFWFPRAYKSYVYTIL